MPDFHGELPPNVIPMPGLGADAVLADIAERAARVADRSWDRATAHAPADHGEPGAYAASFGRAGPRLLPPPAAPQELTVRIDLELDEDDDADHPSVWRRLVVPGDLTLHRLHDVVQVALGWTDSQRHRFTMGPQQRDGRAASFVGDLDEEDGDPGIHERDVRLDEVVAETGHRLYYDYDCDHGAAWAHTIEVEAVASLVVRADPSTVAVRCIGGEGVRPPEGLARRQGDPVVFDLERTDLEVQGVAAGGLRRGVVRDEGLDERLRILVARLDDEGARHVSRWVADAGLDEVDLDDETAQALSAPWRHLLQAVGPDGLKLTGAGYLPPATVVDLRATLPTRYDDLGKGNREEHVRPVADLRRTAAALGLLRTRHGRLHVTALGARLVDDPAALVQHLADPAAAGTGGPRDRRRVADDPGRRRGGGARRPADRTDPGRGRLARRRDGAVPPRLGLVPVHPRRARPGGLEPRAVRRPAPRPPGPGARAARRAGLSAGRARRRRAPDADRPHELLLVGAGHTHLYVVTRAAELVAAGYHVRLLAPRSFHYSGVASATAAGELPVEEGRIDVADLAARSGVLFHEGRLAALDRDRRVAVTEAGEELPYDVLSLNLGSVAAPRGMSVDPAVVRVKPLDSLAGLASRLEGVDDATVTVVGGGATGLELAAHLSVRRGVAHVRLLEAGPCVGADLPVGARRRLLRLLGRRGVEVLTGWSVAHLDGRVARRTDGAEVAHDVAVLATGLAAPHLVAELGLGDEAGAAVGATLQHVDARGDLRRRRLRALPAPPAAADRRARRPAGAGAAREPPRPARRRPAAVVRTAAAGAGRARPRRRDGAGAVGSRCGGRAAPRSGSSAASTAAGSRRTRLRRPRASGQRAEVGRYVDGVGPEHVERDQLERPLVGGGEHDRRGHAVVVGLLPPRRHHAPPVTGREPGEVPLRSRGRQVVADLQLVLEELRGDHRAHRVQADVVGPAGAAAVAVEAGHRVGAAGLELPAQDVALAHVPTLVTPAVDVAGHGGFVARRWRDSHLNHRRGGEVRATALRWLRCERSEPRGVEAALAPRTSVDHGACGG